MNLATTVNFGPALKRLRPIHTLQNSSSQFVGWNMTRDDADPAIALEEAAIETFLKRLSVYREDVR